jgi:hypothetical protein
VRLKPRAKRVLRSLGLRRRRPPWVVDEDQPDVVDPVDSFGLYAIIPTWMEADVIAATVRNAFTQGCERVLVVDNASPDDTVDVAVGAGAELARSFATDQLDEVLKIRVLNETVAHVSESSPHDHVWWLWLDADEFVHGPGGSTVGELVAALDRRFRIVGTRYLNHVPHRRPEYVNGLHPLDLQDWCEERLGNVCRLGHRKHHLQRWDRDGPPITSGLGFHAARAAVTLVEPPINTFTHHFPYRLEETTRRRFDALCGRVEGGPARVDPYDRHVRHNAGTDSDMSKRYRTLQHVYAHDWARIENLRRNGNPIGIDPRPWCERVDACDARVTRWYTPAERDAAVAASPRSACPDR